MSSVNIMEVGPRDGLQNENRPVSLEDKIFLIQALEKAGIRKLEVGAMVRPDRVPQMADTEDLLKKILPSKFTAYTLVPNLKGLERAIACRVSHVAIFTAATDGFTKKNIGMTVSESLELYKSLISRAKESKIIVRGYVSTAFGCPYEGKVSASKPLKVVERLLKLGVSEVSIGDTIGVATPKQVDLVMRPALRHFGANKIAGHFHDTRGTALANAVRSMELGLETLDTSAGGLGGCPYAPGASGNLATEDLVYMLNGMGVKSGIDLLKLCKGVYDFSQRIKRPPTSRMLLTYQSQKEKACFIYG